MTEDEEIEESIKEDVETGNIPEKKEDNNAAFADFGSESAEPAPQPEPEPIAEQPIPEEIPTEPETPTETPELQPISEPAPDEKEVIDSFEITQEELHDPLTMSCEELQVEAQRLTKQSDALGNVLIAFDKETPLSAKITEEKTKIDDNLVKLYEHAFGTCVTH